MAQMNLSTEKKIMDLENRLVVAKGEGEGVGQLWRVVVVSWAGIPRCARCTEKSEQILVWELAAHQRGDLREAV